MKHETPRAAAAFASYCAMGPARSLAKLAETFSNPSSKLRQFSEWSRTHNWQERVKPYDLERAEQRARAREAAIDEMNDRHASVGFAQQQRAVDQIQRLISAQAFGSQAAVQLLKLATDLERVARGVPTSVERQEHTGADGGPMQYEYSLTISQEAAVHAELFLAGIQRDTGQSNSPGGAGDPGGPRLSRE